LYFLDKAVSEKNAMHFSSNGSFLSSFGFADLDNTTNVNYYYNSNMFVIYKMSANYN
jgi:Uri superfamily endonuclease